MHSLTLSGHYPDQHNIFLGEITRVARGWQRSSKAVGGWWRGGFNLSGEDLSRNDLIDFFQYNLGGTVREYCAGGLVSWKGIITEIRLVLDGIEYVHSLEPEWWHNRVKVVYQTLSGLRSETAWSENTSASDEYGEMNYIVSTGKITTAGATALRDRHLEEFAWPRIRMVGGIPFGGSERVIPEDRVTAVVSGTWHTLNWRYYETSTSDTAHNLVDTLAAASEFITVGRTEANALATHIDCSIPQRIGDLIEDIVLQGDDSSPPNVWKGGVYKANKLIYEQVANRVDYDIRGGRLLDKAGVPVLPPLLEPGFLVRNAQMPMAAQAPGTSRLWDNPCIAYVDQVEFIAPDGLRLQLYGQEESLTIMGEQVRQGARYGWG